jgi:phosphatidate cytidylyltransferase
MITGFALILMAVSMRLDLRQAGPNAALLFFGIIYIFGCWKFAIYLRQRSAHWLMYALALNWVGDAAAYYIGRGFGRHRLAPEVSPKKSWEGSAASIAGSMLFGVVYLHFALPSVPWFVALPLSAVVNVAGQVGDLAESALKRGAEVKDSGTLLPGHGGLLDRVDSSLFAMPVVYAFLRLLE